MIHRELDNIALSLMHAQKNCLTIDPITSNHRGFSLADGYAVQQRLHQVRVDAGYKPVGRKIGFTNPQMWQTYGVKEPVWASMYNRTVSRLTTTQTSCNLGQYTQPKIEPEIVVHFCQAPPQGASLAQLIECIDWVANGFEIVQCHFPDWEFKAADTVADDALHGCLMIAPPAAIDDLGANIEQQLKALKISLFCNDECVDTGYGVNALGSPLLAILHLIKVLANQPAALQIQAGEIITTGTLTAAFPIAAEQRWHSEITGIELAGLSLQF